MSPIDQLISTNQRTLGNKGGRGISLNHVISFSREYNLFIDLLAKGRDFEDRP